MFDIRNKDTGEVRTCYEVVVIDNGHNAFFLTHSDETGRWERIFPDAWELWEPADYPLKDEKLTEKSGPKVGQN